MATQNKVLVSAIIPNGATIASSNWFSVEGYTTLSVQGYCIYGTQAVALQVQTTSIEKDDGSPNWDVGSQDTYIDFPDANIASSWGNIITDIPTCAKYCKIAFIWNGAAPQDTPCKAVFALQDEKGT